MRTPRFFSRRRIATAAVEIADQHAFGDFKFQPRRRQAGFQQNLMHQLRQVAVLELHRRQVDGDAQRPRPGRRLAAGGAQNPFAELDDDAALLGQRDEGAGRDHALARMMPAHQRLEAGDLAVDMRLRLIVQREFARARWRCASPAAARAFHAAAGPSTVRRNGSIRAFPILRGTARRRRWRSGASASAPSCGKMATPMVSPTRNGVPSISISVSSAALSFSASASAVAGCGPVGVMTANSSPPTRARKAPWQACSSRLASFAQQRVADRMAEHVVDRLEAVEVEAEQREAFARSRRQFERGGDAFVERRAIRQIGQRIVVRHVRDALLVAFALGEVADDGDEILRLAVGAHDRQTRRRHDAGAVAGRDDGVLVEEYRLARIRSASDRGLRSSRRCPPA